METKKSIINITALNSQTNNNREPTPVEKEKITESKLKLKNAVLTELVCTKDNSGFCNTFNRSGSESLKKIFNDYTDFKLLKSHNVLNKGANGEVTKIIYEKDKFKTVAILKKSLNEQADNLFYEYAVGKYFINRIKNCFPCFCETYALYSDNMEFNEPDKNEKLVINITDELLEKTCTEPQKFSVLSEYVNSEGSLHELINIKQNMVERVFYSVFQVYFTLAVLRKNFTHYDLHSNNVMVYIPKPGHYIHYHYVFNDKTISFKSQYCVKIIDYGRCFFDNKNLFRYNTNASIHDERSDERVKKKVKFPEFEYQKDFESSKRLHIKLKTIEKCVINNFDDYGETIYGYGFYFKEERNKEDEEDTFYIDFSKKNESHDLKLFNIIYGREVKYGIKENIENGILKNTIYNVYDACQYLAQRIENEKVDNDIMYSDPNKEIGDLTVYSDGREMVFSLTNQIVHNLKPTNTTRKKGGSKTKIKSKSKSKKNFIDQTF